MLLIRRKQTENALVRSDLTKSITTKMKIGRGSKQIKQEVNDLYDEWKLQANRKE